MALPRTTAQRVADARTILEEHHADVWVASASRDGSPHLVPLSFQWNGEDVTVALKAVSPTARNIGPARPIAIVCSRDRKPMPFVRPTQMRFFVSSLW